MRVMNPEQVEKLNLCTDATIVERKARTSHTITPTETGLATQGEIETTAGHQTTTQFPSAQAWEPTQVGQMLEGPQKQDVDAQKDLLDFLKPTGLAQQVDTLLTWPDITQNLTMQPPQTRGVRKDEESWKDDPRIQNLVWERLQQLENEAKADGTQGRRKRSGHYNITDNSMAPPYRRWANEAVLVGPARRRVSFDDLSQTQFAMGYIKNVLDTQDPQTKHNMLLELWELLKLADATSWGIAKAVYITEMHAIEDCEISWADRGALLQKRMIQTHVGAFTPQPQRVNAVKGMNRPGDKKLICKFYRAGTCREFGDAHVDPVTGILYSHDGQNRKR